MCILRLLFPRKFKPSRFKTLAKLAISRSSIFKNNQEAKYLQAKSDVIELLNAGKQDRALLRVQLVIKYDHMIEVFAMIMDYCHLLVERVKLLQENDECPDELREAVSSLIFASSRIGGEFPELKKIRRIFESLFGKEITVRAIELRNNCRVKPEIIRNLSTGQPSLKSKYRALKSIANEIGFLYLEDPFSVDLKDKDEMRMEKQKPEEDSDISSAMSDEGGRINRRKRGGRKKYGSAEEAAVEACEAASYAAAAARVAVELSRIESSSSDNMGMGMAKEEEDHSTASSLRREGPMFVLVRGR